MCVKEPFLVVLSISTQIKASRHKNPKLSFFLKSIPCYMSLGWGREDVPQRSTRIFSSVIPVVYLRTK